MQKGVSPDWDGAVSTVTLPVVNEPPPPDLDLLVHVDRVMLTEPIPGIAVDITTMVESSVSNTDTFLASITNIDNSNTGRKSSESSESISSCRSRPRSNNNGICAFRCMFVVVAVGNSSSSSSSSSSSISYC